MLNTFSILYSFHSRFPVTINDENQINVYKHDICNFKEAFLVIKASKTFIGNSRICDMTRMIDTHISDYDGNIIFVGGDDKVYIFVS